MAEQLREADPPAAYSIKGEFDGATVLLTGATGYIGGLLLECLLRTTRVARVNVLLRPKGGGTAADRLAQLLQTSIFHKVRGQQQLLSKVSAIQGDITLPGLGLSPDARQTLLEGVEIVIHTAADIRLELDIHSALKANYEGTESMLELAAGCQKLRALVHTSSCFVNMNLPISSVVRERIYPLRFGANEVDCEELVKDLLSLPKAAADTRAAALGLRWGFPNNYTLSKHLAEQLVDRRRRRTAPQSGPGLPVCIVRPSLVCAVAYEPIPGHVGNWAGPIGACAAVAIGFYHSLGCVSSQPLHVWDVVPADMTANAILAAAAATAAGVGGRAARRAAAAAAGGAAGVPGGSGSGSCEDGDAGAQPLLVVHSSSSSTYPITLMEGWNHALEFIAAHRPRFRLSRAAPPPMTAAFRPDPVVVRRERRWTALKVRLACWLLRLLGQRRAGARLKSGFDALCVYGTSKTDKDLVFCSEALRALEEGLPEGERREYALVMRPGMPLPPQPPARPRGAGCCDGRGGEGAGEGEVPLDGAGGTPGGAGASGAVQQQTLTWRRYYHSQMAGVYSLLFRCTVPRVARAANADVGPVQHDFVYVR